MTAEPTGLFQGLAPLLVNRTVIVTVAADGKGLLTLNVIPKKVKDDESDALTTPCALRRVLKISTATWLHNSANSRMCTRRLRPTSSRSKRTGGRREGRTRSCR